MIALVNNCFSDIDKYADIFNIDRNRAEKELFALSQIKENAYLGQKESRQTIITNYNKLMLSGKLENIEDKICKLIDFDDLKNNDDRIVFEFLLDNCDNCFFDKYPIRNNPVATKAVVTPQGNRILILDKQNPVSINKQDDNMIITIFCLNIL